MLGRALFTVVGLIIAAGLVLPFYPQTGGIPNATSAPDAVALLTAPEHVGGCQDCPVPDAGDGLCPSDCRCGNSLPATFVPPEHSFRLTIVMTVWTLPSWLAEPQPPPPRLPAI